MKQNNKSLVKLITIYLIYFSYTMIISYSLKVFGITNEVVLIFISDLLFLIGICCLYKGYLKECFNKYIIKNTYKRILFMLKWVAILFGINLLGGIITELIVPNLLEDGNTSSIYSIASNSTLYIVFKTLVFATIAETLVYQKTIREVTKNNTLFIVVSGLIYALINIMYTDITMITVIDMISYFIFSSVLSYVYIKNDENILLPMMIKFFYNLIPLILMFISMGV